MDRKEARKAAEVMLAYADGKDIQFVRYGSGSTEWIDIESPVFDYERNNYRIKPTPTYRPFANAEECWEEMKKHEPFGWLTLKEFADNHAFLDEINGSLSFDMYFKEYTFVDGSIFGKLTEEG